AMLTTLGHAVTNTAEATLTTLALDEPLAAKLLDHRDARQRTKLVGAEWLLKHVSPLTNRVHGDYRPLGTVTGRMSCCKPNSQQTPKTTIYRSSIIAAPGHALIKADYSQIQLRISAVMAPDPTMYDVYAHGADLHRLTAASLFGIALADVTPAQRNLG